MADLRDNVPDIHEQRQALIEAIPVTTLPGGRKRGRPRKGEEVVPLKGFKPKRRRLSTGQKLAILSLVDMGLTTREIAFKEKVSERAVGYIKADQNLRLLMENNKAMELTKRSLGNNFYLLADSAVSKAQDPEKLDKMSSFQLAGIAGLAFDKARLAEGLSTENISIRGMVGHIRQEKDNLAALRESLERELNAQETTKEAQILSNSNPTSSETAKP